MATAPRPARSERTARPLTVSVLGVGLVVLGVSGLAGGIALLGGVIELPPSWLEGSPLSDYVVPALALFGFLGVLPLLVALGLYHRRPWAWSGILAAGGAVVVWFAVQASVIGWGNALEWFYLLLGVGILLGAWLPSVRRYASAQAPGSRRPEDR